MIPATKRLIFSLLIASFARIASAQTADEVIAKCIAAQGGRAALAKLKSRRMTGSITLSIPGGEASGSVEILNAAPNRSRSVITIDLSSFGAGQEVIDQGSTARPDTYWMCSKAVTTSPAISWTTCGTAPFPLRS